jgi:myo-inositol-1(or 4)-monophosphatase
MDLAREIAFAHGVAGEAARLLAPWIADAARRSGATREKAAGEVVTEADQAVSELLIERIAAEFPRDAICSEEGSTLDDPSRSRRWIIDPIDGTRSFIRGVPGYSIMIALAIDGEPVLGVVHDLVSGETWHAGKGAGVHVNGERVKPGKSAPRLIWSPFAGRAAGEAVAAGLGVAEIAEVESFGLRAGVMARDGAGVCGSRPGSPHIWDTAPGYVMVHELGGTVSGYDGAPVEYPHAPTLHPTGFVATLGVDHAKACQLFRKHLS